jgi:DNA-binding response OmpR family regulator
MTTSSRTRHVVLVEDLDDDAFFFQVALDETGVPAEVTHLKDGKAALEFLRSLPMHDHNVDIVFLDLKLPGLNGFELLSWIRQQQFNPPLQVIILSGSDQSNDKVTARQLGIEQYLVKPLRVEKLRELLLNSHSGASTETSSVSSSKAGLA